MLRNTNNKNCPFILDKSGIYIGTSKNEKKRGKRVENTRIDVKSGKVRMKDHHKIG